MSETVSGLFKILYFIIVFGLIIFFAYFVSRMLGKRARYNTGKYIKIVDSMYIGTDRMLIIIQVGKEYLLISSASKDIELIKALEDFNEEETIEVQNPIGFSGYFNKYDKIYNNIKKLKGEKTNYSNRDGLDE